MNKASLHWLITALIGLILGAYGWIFSSVLDRIAKAETKIDGMNPVLLSIQTDLSEIKTDLKWLKGNNK